jgi:hypothetical protein
MPISSCAGRSAASTSEVPCTNIKTKETQTHWRFADVQHSWAFMHTVPPAHSCYLVLQSVLPASRHVPFVRVTPLPSHVTTATINSYNNSFCAHTPVHAKHLHASP